MPKARKPRGVRQDGTYSQNLCPHCYSFGCDPMAMSLAFNNKIRNRLRNGCCAACGQPKEFCSCKSSLAGSAYCLPATHNNKKLRKAQAQIKALEDARKAWTAMEDDIADLIGDDVFSDVEYSLYMHVTPDIPLEDIKKKCRGHNVDFSDVEIAWRQTAER